VPLRRILEAFAIAHTDLARRLAFFPGWNLVANRRRTNRPDRAGDRLRSRNAHRAVIAVSGRAVFDPELHGAKAQVHVVRAHHALDQSVGLVAGLVETSGLYFSVDLVPLVAKALGPGLAGAGLALEGPPHGFPGMANSPHLGGDGEEGASVLAHGDAPLGISREELKRRES
jgi:hypothetical protein